jgi:hypothetical protein
MVMRVIVNVAVLVVVVMMVVVMMVVRVPVMVRLSHGRLARAQFGDCRMRALVATASGAHVR